MKPRKHPRAELQTEASLPESSVSSEAREGLRAEPAPPFQNETPPPVCHAPEARHESAEPGGHRRVGLSARAWRRMDPHLAGSGWTPESLLEEVVADALHGAYPEITYRGACIAKAGVYRGFDRASKRPAMRMRSCRGEFIIKARTHNEEYVKWLQIYSNRGEPGPEAKAAEMCLFTLEQELKRPGADKRVIYPEDFLVETPVNL